MKPLVRATYSAYCGREAVIRLSVILAPVPRVKIKVISSGPATAGSSRQEPKLMANSPHHMQKSPK
jgi:hypothetical protein